MKKSMLKIYKLKEVIVVNMYVAARPDILGIYPKQSRKYI